MTTIRSALLASLLLTAALPGQILGQAPEKGDWSVGILLFTNDTGTVFNAGRQWTDRLHVGIELDLREASIEDDVTDVSLGVDTKVAASEFLVGPVAKWYGRAVGPVVPFLRARVVAGWGDQVFEQAGVEQWREDTFQVAASLGIGAEWFPMRQVSFSGYTGIQTSKSQRERVFPSGAKAERTTLNSGTFRSALSISFYFR